MKFFTPINLQATFPTHQKILNGEAKLKLNNIPESRSLERRIRCLFAVNSREVKISPHSNEINSARVPSRQGIWGARKTG